MTKFEIIYVLFVVIKIVCIFIIYYCVEKQIEENRKQIQKLKADNIHLIIKIEKMMKNQD